MEGNEASYELKSSPSYGGSSHYSINRSDYSSGLSFYSMQNLGGRQYGR